MKTRLDLGGTWHLERMNPPEHMDAQVPGTLLDTLHRTGRIPDLYDRDQDSLGIQVTDDCPVWSRTFDSGSAFDGCDVVHLRFEGLCTMATIRLNGHELGRTRDMHRTYEFEVKRLLLPADNRIEIRFDSPVRHVAERQAESPLWGEPEGIPGYAHIRQAHYMLGWDWSAQLPDIGIWRPVLLIGSVQARIHDVLVSQKHRDGAVGLAIRIRAERFAHGTIRAKVILATPEGGALEAEGELGTHACAESAGISGILPVDRLLGQGALVETTLVLDVPQPRLWWPNGYGDQPLYRLETVLFGMEPTGGCVSEEGETRSADAMLDHHTMHIGLRTLTVRREKDKWGESFAFEINGLPIFARGANYVPEDSLLPRCTVERTERLLHDCVAAHFNCVRVWGGGYFAEDHFYDLCDRLGLIVWQDLLFACAVYELTPEFTEDIVQETRDNMRRIRHHACLGLWCGNNEMEWGWVEWPFPKTERLRTDYVRQFEILLPEIARQESPDTFYWVASPSSGGGFDNPNDPNRGNVHYWEVWHKLKPFTEYQKHFFRFCSEFGFQSFPCRKTVETFTRPEDRNIFSPVMERHQKDDVANGKILYYLSETFRYPKDFDTLLYASQALQGMAIRHGVEHWRRNRGRCMGAIYWQLNDCWPVASWASIDYFGRWKALHYMARRFFAPVLLSACEEGAVVDLVLSNERVVPVEGRLHWKLCDHRDGLVAEGYRNVRAEAMQAAPCARLDFTGSLRTETQRQTRLLSYRFEDAGGGTSEGTLLFVKPKHFQYMNPYIETAVSETPDAFLLDVSARHFAMAVALDLTTGDCRFDDNWFDLEGGQTRRVRVPKETLSERMDCEAFVRRLTVTSVFDLDPAQSPEDAS